MIRRPNRSDRQRLIDFFKLMVTDTFEKEGVGHLKEDIQNEIQEKIKYLDMDLESNGQLHYFLIMEEEGRLIGTAALGKASHLITDLRPELEHVQELGSVFIHPEEQGKGYGKLLVNEITKDLKCFCLDSGYSRAQRVWNHIFGPPYHTAKDFWDTGIDHLIWYKI